MVDLRDKMIIRKILTEHMRICKCQYEYDGELDFLYTMSDMRHSARESQTDICDVIYKELDSLIDGFCGDNDLCDICFEKLQCREYREVHYELDGNPVEVFAEKYCVNCD